MRIIKWRMAVPAALAVVYLTTGTPARAQVNILPKPVKMETRQGSFRLTSSAVIVVKDPSLKPAGEYFSDIVASSTGMRLPVKEKAPSGTPCIVLQLDVAKKSLGDEGYTLKSSPSNIFITGNKPAGVFYGIQTLRQLFPAELESREPVHTVEWSAPLVTIEDRPRLKWRGYLLDVSRHFRTKEEVLRAIDLLAMQKLNVLQFHLTDDQGWRIEIKKYPKLTEIGSRVPDYSGNTGDNWFYTQQDIRDIVQYAASRYITVVPEIEMPGHSMAATTAYPGLGCDDRPSHDLCVSRENTFHFMTGVLDEVLGLFPSQYIHVGADEVRPERWRECSACGREMERLMKVPLPPDVPTFRVPVKTGAGRPYHEDIARLQGEFVRRINSFLASRGRTMIGWDEIIEGGLKKGTPAAVMAWRSGEVIRGATDQAREVVATIYPDYYLDVSSVSLQRTYEYDPLPEQPAPLEEKYLVGVQGNMWGERLRAIDTVDRLTFPRLCAIAEIGWTQRSQRDFADFKSRLEPFSKRLILRGVRYSPPVTGQSVFSDYRFVKRPREK